MHLRSFILTYSTYYLSSFNCAVLLVMVCQWFLAFTMQLPAFTQLTCRQQCNVMQCDAVCKLEQMRSAFRTVKQGRSYETTKLNMGYATCRENSTWRYPRQLPAREHVYSYKKSASGARCASIKPEIEMTEDRIWWWADMRESAITDMKLRWSGWRSWLR